MTQTHPVSDGKVYCALQHRLVDVMACYGCVRVVEIDLDTRRPKVVCSVKTQDDAREPIGP